MYNSVLSTRYSNYINFLLFCFPVVIISVKALGESILFILAVTGIVLAIANKTLPFNSKPLRLFSWLTFGYFLVVVMSVVFSGQFSFLAHYIPRELHFFFAPFIGLAILKAKVSLDVLLLGIKLGLIVLGGIVFYQYLGGVARPSGVMNADVFGNLAVMMLFLSVIKIFEENLWARVFTLVAALMGLGAIVLSGTRGAWLSFVLLIPVYIWLVYSRYLSGNHKSKLIVLLILASIIGTAASTKVVQDRVLLAVTEVQQWYSGENKHTSVGLRLEMWSSALQATKQSPWLGYGYRNTNPVVSVYASDKTMKTITGFNHLHNEYITNLLAKGVFGLVFLLLLLFLPLAIFVKGLKDEASHSYASMGVLLCVGYASFALVNLVFGDGFMNAFYVFFLALLLPMVMRNFMPTLERGE